MGNPLAVLPYAIGAHGGTVDGISAASLVGAGLTLLQRSGELVRRLYGRRAGILLPTGPEFLVALAASDGRGAVLLNPLCSAREIAAQIDDAQVGVVFTLAILAPMLPPSLPVVLLDDAPGQATLLLDGGARTIDLGSHVGLDLAGDREAPGSDEEAVVVYTSAMAGRALGAILTHRNLLANGHSTVAASALCADDHVLALLPYSHLFGLTVTLSAPLLAGARVTTMRRFNPVTALELLADQQVTLLNGVPAMFIAMLTVIERRGGLFPLPSLRMSICGGAVLPAWVQERWELTTGCALRQGYGLTEAGPVALFNRIDRPNRIGTLGAAYPNVEVTIRDSANGEECPVGSTGEICVRGTLVGSGYVSGGIDGLERRNGWLHTGDLGHADAEGYVTFDGLIKPMFTHNGFNIFPAELQRVIESMPGVTRVDVSGVPDATREHIVAIVVHGDVAEDAVRVWCAEWLASYKQPTRISVVVPTAITEKDQAAEAS
jgi:long-chain acyl-CoA synthetase